MWGGLAGHLLLDIELLKSDPFLAFCYLLLAWRGVPEAA